MTSPRVSVLMPVYNGERYLREAVESILGQTFTDFEFIIVDDGSTDGTKAILGNYTDSRIVRLENSTNQGLVAALNMGLRAARGEYIARQDADDISALERFSRQNEYLDKHSAISVVGASAYEIDAEGKRLGILEIPTKEIEIKWHALFQNPFIHSAVMFRREIVAKLGGYSSLPQALHVEDYELWLRLLWSGFGMANLSSPLIQRRLNTSGVSSSNTSRQAVNFRTQTKHNLHRLGIEPADCSLLWSLQVGGGVKTSVQKIQATLKDLEQLTENFADYFSLDSHARKYVRKMAIERAARTLLHIAECRAYDLRLDEARAFAELAVQQKPDLLCSPSYWRVIGKSRLGPHRMASLRRLFRGNGAYENRN